MNRKFMMIIHNGLERVAGYDCSHYIAELSMDNMKFGPEKTYYVVIEKNNGLIYYWDYYFEEPSVNKGEECAIISGEALMLIYRHIFELYQRQQANKHT